MRFTLCTAVLAILTATMSAQPPPSPLEKMIKYPIRVSDPRELDPCGLGVAIEELGRKVSVSFGYEGSAGCEPTRNYRRRGIEQIAISPMSARAAFDYVVSFRAGYSWREINGVAVVRPNGTWSDGHNPLNMTTGPVAMKSSLHEILHAVLRGAPDAYKEHTDVPHSAGRFSQPMQFDFEGGSVLDALNATVTSFRAEWQVSYPGTRHGVLEIIALDSPKTVIMQPLNVSSSR